MPRTVSLNSRLIQTRKSLSRYSAEFPSGFHSAPILPDLLFPFVLLPISLLFKAEVRSHSRFSQLLSVRFAKLPWTPFPSLYFHFPFGPSPHWAVVFFLKCIRDVVVLVLKFFRSLLYAQACLHAPQGLPVSFSSVAFLASAPQRLRILPAASTDQHPQ